MEGDLRHFHFTVIHWYLVPLVACVVWWGMLIAMLACWGAQGRPIYSFMTGHQNPVYLSDIGATNLKPLFISCAGFQGIFFVGTLLLEFFLRKTGRLQPWVLTKQPIFSIISIIFAIIGELAILMVSIFDTKNFHTAHISMVGVFIGGIFFACLFNFFNTFIFGNMPQRLNPDHEKVVFGKRRWDNLYMVSFFGKILWLIVAIVLAACFGYYMKHDEDTLLARFEWAICFWYGFLLILWSLDLFPLAVKNWKRRHGVAVSHSRDTTPLHDDTAIRELGDTLDTPGQVHYRSHDSDMTYTRTWDNEALVGTHPATQEKYTNF